MDGSHQMTSAGEVGGLSARLMPRQTVPGLRLPLLGGGIWDLSARPPAGFTLIVFYRGWHCPVCTTYLRELDRLHAEFTTRGIDVLVASSDGEARAELAARRWDLPNLAIGYDLPIPVARAWGLYISSSRGKSTSGIEEPAYFSEPAVYVIRPDRTLYWGSVQTMPFARPHFAEMIQAFDMIRKLDYPARGEL